MRALSLLVLLAACAPQAPAPSTTEAPSASAPTADATPTPAGDWQVYGDAFSDSPAVSLSTLLADAASRTDQVVNVEGKVSEVCQKAGCWMVVSEGEQHMRIRMKDHGFSVDKAGAGKVCQVQGTLVARDIDPSEVAHFASETRSGGVVPEEGQQGKVYEIVATSVRMRNDG